MRLPAVISVVIIIMLSGLLKAQQANWVRNGGGTVLWDIGLDVAVDQKGFCYSAGMVNVFSSDPCNFGKDTVRGKFFEPFLIRYDLDGNVDWLLDAGGSASEMSSGVALNSNESEIIWVGYYGSSDAQIGNISLPAPATNTYSIFIAKVDTGGAVKWVKTASGLSNWMNMYDIERGHLKVTVDASDNIYVAGIYHSDATFGTTTLTSPYKAAGGNSPNESFVAKLNASGNFQWVKNVTGPGYTNIQDIAVDDAQNIYCVGDFKDTIIFNGVQDTGIGPQDAFLAKLDPQGNVSWLHTHHSKVKVVAQGVATDHQNRSVYVVGHFKDTATFDTTKLISNGKDDGFVIRYDTAGKVIWARQIYDKDDVKVRTVDTDSSGYCFVGGRFRDSASFGSPAIKLNGWFPLFYSLMDSSGAFLWARNSAGVGIDEAMGVGLNDKGNMYVNGSFQASILFDNHLASSNGDRDVFTASMLNCIKADTAQLHVPTIDSVCFGDTVRLSSNNDTTLQYQWLFEGAPLYLGTDTVYKATLNGNYRLVVWDGECRDTSLPTRVTVHPIPAVTLADFPITCIFDSNFILTQGSPSGGVYSGTGVLSDSIFSPSTAGLGTFPIQYTYTDSFGCTDSVSKDIRVAGQSAGLFPFSDVCENSASFSLFGGTPSGGNYFGNGVTGTIFNPSSAGAGNHTISYVYSILGCTDTATTTLTVQSVTPAAIDTLPDQCMTGPLLVLSPSGSPSGGYFFGTGVNFVVFDPTISGAGNHSISYVYTSGICQDTANTTIYVDSLPQASLSTQPDYCSSDTAVVLNAGSPSGGVYRVNGVITDSIHPQSLGKGFHTVEYLFTNVCGTDTATQMVEVKDTVDVTWAPLNAVCLGTAPFVLSGGIPAGGTYSGPGVNNGMFDPAVAGIGIHTLSYIFILGKTCVDSTTQTIEVHAQPTVTLSAFSPVCASASSFTLTGGSPGAGSYNGPGVSVGQFDAAVAGAGNHIINYVYQDSNNCIDSASQTLQVDSLPIVDLSPDSSCLGVPAYSLTQGIPSGGVYSGPGISGGQFDPTTAGVGSHLISYSFTDGNNCTANDTARFEVNTPSSVSLNALSPVCHGDSAFALSGGNPAGGLYSGTGVSSGQFDPALSGVGSFSVMYSFTDSNTCLQTDTQQIIVHAQPVVSLSPLSALCADTSAIVLTGGLPIGGSFQGIGVNAGQFDPSLSGVGSYVVTYHFTDSNSCSDRASQVQVVDSVPVVTLVRDSVCSGTPSVVLTQGAPMGGVYSGVAILAGQFDPSIAGVGVHSYQYSFTDSRGCSESAIDSMVVLALPTLNFPALNSTCEQSATLVLNSATPSGGVYSGTGVVGSTFNPQLAGVGSHSITYTYTDPVTLCSDSLSQNLVVDSNPIASIPTYSNHCSNHAAMTLTGALPAGGSYSGPGVSGGQFDPVLAGSGNHTLTYIFSDSKGCRDTANSILVVDTTPVVSFTPLSAICHQSTAKTLSGGSPAGGVYKGSGVSTGQFDPQLAGLGSHTLRYVVVDGNNCSDSATQIQVVDTTPTISFTLIDSICINGGQLSLQATPAGGNYTGTGVSGNNFDPVLAGKGKHHLTYSYTASNGCPNSHTDSIRVDSLTPLQFLLPDSICQNATSLALSASPAGGYFQGSGVSGSIFDPGLLTIGSYAIYYHFTNSFGCHDSTGSIIRVDSVPVVTLTPLADVCLGDTLLLSGGNPLGGTYSGIDVQAGVFKPQSSGSFSIQYRYENQFGCSQIQTDTLKVNALPVLGLSEENVLCANAPLFTLITGSPAGGSYFGAAVVNDTLFNASLVGAGITVMGYTYTDTNGCTDSIQKLWTVDTVPFSAFQSVPDLCSNQGIYHLSQGSPLGGRYFGPGIQSDTLFDAGIGYGDHVVYYTYTDGNGCHDTSSQTIHVDTILQVASFDPPALCVQSQLIVISGGQPLGGKYSGPDVIRDSLFVTQGKAAGNYPLLYTLTSRCGKDSMTADLIIHALPEPNLNALPTICEGAEAVELHDYVNPAGGTFSINGSPGSLLRTEWTETPPLVSYDYTDSNGCFNTLNQSITINQLPDATVFGESEFCSSDSVHLSNLSSGIREYRWNGVAGNADYTQFANDLGLGTQTIGLEVQSDAGCWGKSEKQVNIVICESQVWLYPNPNQGKFTVEAKVGTAQIVKFKIMTSIGQELGEFEAEAVPGNNSFQFDLPMLSVGAYVLEIQLNDQYYYEKVVIE